MPADLPIPGHLERAPAVAGCEQVQAKIDAEQAAGYIGQRPRGAWPRDAHDLASAFSPAALLALHRHHAFWHFPDLAE